MFYDHLCWHFYWSDVSGRTHYDTSHHSGMTCYICYFLVAEFWQLTLFRKVNFIRIRICFEFQAKFQLTLYRNPHSVAYMIVLHFFFTSLAANTIQTQSWFFFPLKLGNKICYHKSLRFNLFISNILELIFFVFISVLNLVLLPLNCSRTYPSICKQP